MRAATRTARSPPLRAGVFFDIFFARRTDVALACVYCGRFYVSRSDDGSDDTFGLFAHQPIHKGDVLTGVERFGHRVRFCAETPLILSEFDVIANVYMWKYWRQLAEAWNFWADAQRNTPQNELRNESHDTRRRVEWVRRKCRAPKEPCVFGAPPHFGGETTFQDFYVGFLTVYGFMRTDAEAGNVVWEMGTSCRQLVAVRSIKRGEEIVLGFRRHCSTRSPPIMYFPPPRTPLPPLLL